jgi:hypothetical protein
MHKRKNKHDLKISPPLNLSLSASPEKSPTKVSPSKESPLKKSASKKSPSIFSCLSNLTPRFARLFSFNNNILRNRHKFSKICDEDLSVIKDLGSGASGTVLKVEHKETSIIMAKKV